MHSAALTLFDGCLRLPQVRNALGPIFGATSLSLEDHSPRMPPFCANCDESFSSRFVVPLCRYRTIHLFMRLITAKLIRQEPLEIPRDFTIHPHAADSAGTQTKFRRQP